jgi:hypothetical protein
MSARQDTLRLRLELLRMRAQIERSEIAAAVVDLQVSTRRLRRFGAVASSLGAAASGGTGGWLGQIVGVLSQRPWITAAVVGVLRTARRHPWLAIVAVGAVVIAARWQRRGSEAEAERSAEAEHAPRPSADETGD